MDPPGEESVSSRSTAENIPGFLKPGMKPFDPLDITRDTQPLVSRDDARKYTRFYRARVYGGISTGYTVGCNLRCIFCWVGFSRDFPHRHGRLYSAAEAAQRLTSNARKKGYKKMRISGGEPTLCREHLMNVLEITESSGMMFILETNGILLGADESYVGELKRFSHVHLRLSLKAGDPAGWEDRTGATRDSFDFPYIAVRYLIEYNMDFHVAAMTDPELMSEGERENLFLELEKAGYSDWVEEENCDPYELSLFRLEASGRGV